MGLFSFIKKKKAPSHAQVLQVVYQSGFKEPFNSLLFPNGTEQIDKIVRSMAKIANVKLDTNDPMTYLNLAQMYALVYSLHVVNKSTNNFMMRKLQEKHPDLAKDRDTARKVLIFSFLHMEDHNFSLDQPDHINKMNGMEYLFIENDKIASQNTLFTNRFVNDVDYGLVKEKPVYCDGAAGASRYLNSLLTIKGENLIWQRVNVHNVEGVNGLVDEYEGKLLSGKVYASVFCNLYAYVNPDFFPKGFKQKSLEQMHTEYLENLKN